MSEQKSLLAPELRTVAVPSPDSGAAMLSVIAEASRDPQVDVAKLEALLSMKERIDAKQAETAFNRDFAAAKLEMPRVAKNGTIELGGKGKIKFGTYEDIDKVIRPIEAKYGFARSFRTSPSDQPGILMACKLAHRDGHSETSTRQMPPDPGPGRNAMQAIGSASSYAKRYLTLDIWDLVLIGQDDDGRASGSIEQEQAAKIEDMLSAIAENESADEHKKTRAAFLKFMGVPMIRDIQKHDFDKALQSLRDKFQRVRTK